MLKKFKTIFLTFLMLVVSILLLACDSKKEATFVIKNGDAVENYVIDLNKDEFKEKSITVYDVLKSSSYQKVFNADIFDGELPYLNSIEMLVPNSERYEFLALYSTLEDYRTEGFDKTFNDVTYYSSSVGIGELPVKENAYYLFMIDTWADYDQELATLKTSSKNELLNSVNVDELYEDYKNEVETLFEQYKKLIDECETIKDVENKLAEVKDLVANIVLNNNSRKQLDDYKDSTINKITIDLSLYRENEQNNINNYINETKNKINNSSTLEEINDLYNDFQSYINSQPTNESLLNVELQNRKNEVKEYINSYLDLSLYRDNEVSSIEKVIQEFISKIELLNTIEEVTNTLNEYITKLDEIKTDSELKEEEEKLKPTISTNIIDGNIYKSSQLTFDVYAKDHLGNKLPSSNVIVTLNGKNVNVNWDDSTKTSYTVEFVEMENVIKIVAIDNNFEREVVYHVQFEESAINVTLSIDAFTIGNGYVIEPTIITINDELIGEMATFFEYNNEEMREEMNGAFLLAYMLHLNEYKLNYTASLSSGFYLSNIEGFKHSNNVPENLREKLEEGFFELEEEPYDEMVLGEFDYTYGAGWMYSVNNQFPNVGFSDYHPQDGDVIRVQFTLAYGLDIGGAEAMGGMFGESYFEEVNRDNLTKIIAEAIAKGKTELSEYSSAYELIQLFGLTQKEIDDAYNELFKAINE